MTKWRKIGGRFYESDEGELRTLLDSEIKPGEPIRFVHIEAALLLGFVLGFLVTSFVYWVSR